VIPLPPSQTKLLYIELSEFLNLYPLLSRITSFEIFILAPFKAYNAGPSNV
jgi:hypothetical protein